MPKTTKKVVKKEDNKAGGSAKMGSTKFPTLTQKNFLQVDELEPDQIYVIPKFLNAKECDQLVHYFETHLPPIASAGGRVIRLVHTTMKAYKMKQLAYGLIGRY
ncbi:hypothetical protein G6F42_021950 [Rhizopus arrhizus]|nr:hypothetical protein G6F42_021950 [Rhizopus arrhizus]